MLSDAHQLMHQAIGTGCFPGAVLLVAKEKKIVHFEAYGRANLFNRTPMTRDTVFDLASLTKPLATTIALIPPFTPTIMVMRMASSVTIPMWQPVVGLLGVILFTIFTVWIGARIFRTAILIQGQKPNLATLYKYAFKG